MTNRKAKSNRAQADYFELLVGQHIAQQARVGFSYNKEIAELSNKILKLPNGQNRLELQNKNLIRIIPEIDKIIDFETKQKGKIIEVRWIGRRLNIKTTSDIDAEHLSKLLTRFSIKSIEGLGTGTIKNLGLRALNQYLGTDFSKQSEAMWDGLREFTGEHSISQNQLKRKVRRNKKWLQWATENGKKFQKELNLLSYKSFNNLLMKDRLKFLSYILDTNDKDLYVIIVNANRVTVFKPVDDKLRLTDKITAKKDSNVGYKFLINGVPTYRIQTNNTNGIGISPFCQRVFKI